MVPTSQACTPSASSHAPPHQPILLCLPAPAGPEVSGQTSEVSEDPAPPAAVSAAPPDLTSGLRPLTSDVAPPAFAAEQLRDLVEIGEVIRCAVRPRVLLSLAAAGKANVGLLAERINANTSPDDDPVTANQLSNHLGRLKDLGLLFCTHKGKEHWYEVVAARVRYQRQPGDGGASAGFVLTITGRGGGVQLPVTVATPADHRPEPSRPAANAGVDEK